MAVNGRVKRRAAYRDGVYVQGNTARRIQAVPDRNEPVKKISARTRKNRERAKHMNRLCAFHGNRYGGGRLYPYVVSDAAVGYHQQRQTYCRFRE